MKRLMMALLLVSSVAHAAPEAKVTKAKDGNLSIEFFNDTGQPLRFLIYSEGWYQDKTEGTITGQWVYETGSILGNGYFAATTKGRKERIGSQTISDVFHGLPKMKYGKVKLKIILEWDDGDPHTWNSPKSHISHTDVTELVQ